MVTSRPKRVKVGKKPAEVIDLAEVRSNKQVMEAVNDLMLALRALRREVAWLKQRFKDDGNGL